MICGIANGRQPRPASKYIFDFTNWTFNLWLSEFLGPDALDLGISSGDPPRQCHVFVEAVISRVLGNGYFIVDMEFVSIRPKSELFDGFMLSKKPRGPVPVYEEGISMSWFIFYLK